MLVNDNLWELMTSVVTCAGTPRVSDILFSTADKKTSPDNWSEDRPAKLCYMYLKLQW